MDAARSARDRGDLPALRAAIAEAQQKVRRTRSFDAWLHLAVLHNWMCEAAEARRDTSLVKQAAKAGVGAAEAAVALTPRSSDAHQVLADLLGQLIPHVFGGGMRYGRRATAEADKAIQLDPRNPNAYVTRAISYLYTPEAFGGSKQKALELLRKAVELDPQADTPHVWLAQYHASVGQREEGLREVATARRLNPGRLFTRNVHDQLRAAGRPAASDSKIAD
jgi:tetratricopeptide (TPR) repeat protein